MIYKKLRRYADWRPATAAAAYAFCMTVGVLEQATKHSSIFYLQVAYLYVGIYV